MLPVRVELHNYMSHIDSVEDFKDIIDESHIALIFGYRNQDRAKSNGAGKSTIFDAIGWAIWGDARCANESLINDFANEAYVQVDFIGFDGNTYRVRREISRSKSGGTSCKLYFYYLHGDSWVLHDDQEKKGQKAATSLITSKVGIDIGLFRQSAYFEQGNISCFSESIPSKRKEIFSELTKLARYEICRKIASQVRTEREAEKKSLEVILENMLNSKEDLASLEIMLLENKKNVDSIKKNILVLEKEIQLLKTNSQTYDFISQVIEKKQSSQRSLTNYERILKDAETGKQKLQIESQQKHADLRAKYEKIPEYEKLVREKTKQVEEEEKKEKKNKDADISISEKRIFLATIKAKEEYLTKTLKNIKEHGLEVKDMHDTECPFCFSEINEKSKDKVLEKLRDKYEIERRELISAKEEIVKIEKEVEQLQNSIVTVVDISNMKIEISRYVSKIEEKPQIKLEIDKNKKDSFEKNDTFKKQIESAKENIKTTQQSILEDEKKIRELSNDKNYQEISTKLNAAESGLRSAKNDQERLIRESGSLESRISSAKNSLKEQEKTKKDMEELTNDIGVYKELDLIFGKKGIQALIIENSLNALEASARGYLKRFSDSEMDIMFRTLAPTSDGKKELESLDILVKNRDGKWRDYRSYSGGEKLRVDFSIRISLSKLIAKYSDYNLQCLFIDESCAPLDVDGKEVYCEILNELAREFSLILVVTHMPELQEKFSNVIIVENNDGKSKILPREKYN